MGMDNITCPSKAPVAGCAVGVPASVRTRGFGPQLAAARLSCGLGLRSLGWLANAGGTAECGSLTARGNAVCGRTACTVWEGAGGNAPMMPSPMWIAGWHIGGAPLAYLITHGASGPLLGWAGCAYEAGRSGRAGQVWRSPMSIKGPLRRRGGCARKAVGLIRGGLHGGPRCPVRLVRGVVRDGGVREGVARRGEVSRRRSTSGDLDRWEGLNAKPRRRTLVLVGWTLKAANPVRGLGGRAGG